MSGLLKFDNFRTLRRQPAKYPSSAKIPLQGSFNPSRMTTTLSLPSTLQSGKQPIQRPDPRMSMLSARTLYPTDMDEANLSNEDLSGELWAEVRVYGEERQKHDEGVGMGMGESEGDRKGVASSDESRRFISTSSRDKALPVSPRDERWPEGNDDELPQNASIVACSEAEFDGASNVESFDDEVEAEDDDNTATIRSRSSRISPSHAPQSRLGPTPSLERLDFGAPLELDFTQRSFHFDITQQDLDFRSKVVKLGLSTPPRVRRNAGSSIRSAENDEQSRRIHMLEKENAALRLRLMRAESTSSEEPSYERYRPDLENEAYGLRGKCPTSSVTPGGDDASSVCTSMSTATIDINLTAGSWEQQSITSRGSYEHTYEALCREIAALRVELDEERANNVLLTKQLHASAAFPSPYHPVLHHRKGWTPELSRVLEEDLSAYSIPDEQSMS